MLNALQEYFDIWGKEVNTDKTKVIVFKNGEPLSRYEDTIEWKASRSSK